MKYYSGELFNPEEIIPFNGVDNLWASADIITGITTTGITVLDLDAGNLASYPKSGNLWYDLTGRENNAYLNTGNEFQTIGGGSMRFDGTQGIGVGVSPDFSSLNTNITLDSVIYCDNLNDNRQICSKGFGYQYRFRVQNNGSLWIYCTNNGEMSGGHIYLNTWTYVAAVLSDTGFRIYINGELVNSNSVPYNPATAFSDTSGHYVGAYNSMQEQFSGYIATQRRYNRALNDSEIMNNFTAIRSRFGI